MVELVLLVQQSFLMSHITWTYHAHQALLLPLQSFNKYSSLHMVSMMMIYFRLSLKYEQFWSKTITMEKLFLIIIKAHLENYFHLYVEALEYIVAFFFVSDHYNYACWISVHIFNTKTLPATK